MRVRSWTGSLLLILVSAPSLAAGEGTDVATQIQASNRFACELYQRLNDGSGDLVLSPYSASCALAMAYAGARNNTEREMARTLHFILPAEELGRALSGGGDGGRADSTAETTEEGTSGATEGTTARITRVRMANALWCDRELPLDAGFTGLLDRSFGAGARRVDFRSAPEEARGTINAWVSDRTEKRIENLLRPGDVTTSTALVLVNAVYFFGSWAHPFRPEGTLEGRFAAVTGDSIPAYLMHQVARFRYAANDTLQIVELPYTGGIYSLYVMLPTEATGIRALEAGLSGERLERWIQTMTEHRVDLTLPRFRINSRFALAQTLAAMGMPDAFSSTADFSGIAKDRNLSISQVVQAAWLELNERSTEAAAATAVVTSWGGLRGAYDEKPPVVFRADRPFLFVIADRSSDAILFLGRVTTPEFRPVSAG